MSPAGLDNAHTHILSVHTDACTTRTHTYAHTIYFIYLFTRTPASRIHMHKP